MTTELTSRHLRLGTHVLPLSRTLVMGVLNVTPDSFTDGGLYADVPSALAHAREMAADGADIIDVGGESTRPGAEPVPLDEELRRVLPVVEALVGELDVAVSIDTIKPDVAQRCLRAGAVMVNDTSGRSDAAMLGVVADAGAALAIMHTKGTPQTMAREAVYDDLMGEVRDFLGRRAASARDAGIETVVVDPGLGFAKTAGHNLAVIRRLGEIAALGFPVLIGPSRKAFIGALTGMPPDGRLAGTIAAVVGSAMAGADIVRVHDVAACKQALAVADALRHA